MQSLDPYILELQEGTQVPSIIWKVILRLPLPSDSETEYNDIDISERLMNEPNISDTADYRENLTYINEIGVKLNNADKALTNEAGNGILDTDDPIEIFIDGYYDAENGEDFTIRKFGGWIDRDRMKTDSVKMNCELLAYSYFGKAERVSGLNVCRRYMDDNGLRLYTAKVWVTDAHISGYELKKGLHYITTFFDTNPKAKLDDGDPVILLFDSETTLSNADGSQKVKVYYSGFDHAEERVSTMIVRSQGQYPETYYYFATIEEIVRKCFESIGITNMFIQNYTIDTFDGRQIISGSNRVDNTADQFIPVAIEFDGTDKYYIAGAFTGSPNKNQIWEYNRTTAAIRLIYETTLNDNTKYKLIYDRDEQVLLAFIDSVEDEDPGFIQKFVINDAGATNTTLLFDLQYDSVNPYYRFHYSKFLKKFIYLGLDGSTKTMFELDLDGVQTDITTDANFELNGFSCIYESGSTVIFYYIKNVSGTRKLYKRTYGTGWSEVYVADWFDAGNYNNWYGYKFVAEGKVFITNFEVSRFLNVAAGTFSADLTPADTRIYSPFESNGKLFVVTKDADNLQKLASFTADVLSYETEVIAPYDIVQSPALFGFQQICEYVSTDLAVLSKYPALMLRYASKFTSLIEGEFDTSGMTVREILQELANNFLGYVKVSPGKKGYFIGRNKYNFEDTLVFKRDYNKERIAERVYNERYDRVEITNGSTADNYGEDGIDLNIKSLELRFLPDGFLKDYAKYFLEYYDTKRKIIKIKYPPTFYNYENLDKADLTDYGYEGEGIIHKVSPKKSSCEFEILI